MLNIKFPDTPYVKCVFNWRQNNNNADFNTFDDIGRKDPTKLKRYLYKLPNYLQGQISAGDVVLVYCQTGYQVCEVVSINEPLCGLDEKSVAPVVAKINMTEYLDELYRQRQLKVMRMEIERKKKELESQVTYDLLAEKSPEFAALLKSFREAGGSL